MSYFYSLYDEEIITEETFHAWESSSDEEPGKGVAVTAASEFFRWLKSAPEESFEFWVFMRAQWICIKVINWNLALYGKPIQLDANKETAVMLKSQAYNYSLANQNAPFWWDDMCFNKFQTVV